MIGASTIGPAAIIFVFINTISVIVTADFFKAPGKYNCFLGIRQFRLTE